MERKNAYRLQNYEKYLFSNAKQVQKALFFTKKQIFS